MSAEGGIASEGDPTGAVPLFVAPGHFYSPVPDPEEVERHAAALFGARTELPGVELGTDGQLALARGLLEHLTEFDPPLERDLARGRYWSNNDFYPFGDAAVLSFVVRERRPRLAVEIGSGFSTAALLDARDRERARTGDDAILARVHCVEPYPARLRELLSGADLDRITLDEARLQEADLGWVDQLAAGDILVVDSSHVLKTGSDLWWLFDRVLPNLAPGVWIHFHDVLWPFEYPRAWVREGRAWNEAYALRLFLQFNASFALRFQLTHVLSRDPERLRVGLGLEHDLATAAPPGLAPATVERLVRDPGSACWIERVRA